MIDYKYANLFQQDSVDKQLIIQFDTTTITNEDLFNQSLTLEESLCSDSELRFGSCEASVIKFKVANIVSPMINKWITVKMYLEGHRDDAFVIGKYKVVEDKVTADRQWRNIVAYDALYDIINADVAAWYNSVLPEKSSTMTMKQFRTSFISHFGLEQVDPDGGLVNDDMVVERTIEPEQISGKDVITAICEINGCFGHIGRDGKFHWIYLEHNIRGLYPADDLYPSDSLYPIESKTTGIGSNGSYISCQYEDYTTQSITKLQIRKEEDDIGKIYPETPLSDEDNCYIIQDNFLVYGKSSEELLPVAQNIFNKITGIIYRPFNADVKGNPCLEVGDPIRLTTKYELVESYILQRTLKGIQALKDDYEAQGTEVYAEQVNGVHKSIIQLKGKTNILERTIEETRLEITDLEAGLKNEISITAKGLQADITAEKERAEGEEEKLSSSIKVTAEQIKTEVSKTYETKSDAGATKTELKSSISQNASAITAEVKRAQGQEVELAAAISINADSIKSKVTKGDISSEISQEAGKVSIKSNRFSLESDNTKIYENGTIECKNIKITGGSIQIETALDTYDYIKLKQMTSSGNWTTVRETTLNTFGLECIDVSGGHKVNYSGSGIYSDSPGASCKIDKGMFNEIYSATNGVNLKILSNTDVTGNLSVSNGLTVSNKLTAASITVNDVLGAYTLKKDKVKTISGALGVSTKQLTIPAGYMFSSNVTFAYNATVNGYVISAFSPPTLVNVSQNNGYVFANSVSFADKNVVGY